MTAADQRIHHLQPGEPTAVLVSCELDGDRLTVSLVGELDAFSSTAVQDRVRQILDDSGDDLITLDLAGVEFCDCAGVRALIAMHRMITARGGACMLRHLPPHVAGLLRTLNATTALGLDHPRAA